MNKWKVIIEGVEDEIDVQQDIYALAHKYGAISYSVSEGRDLASISFSSENEAKDFDEIILRLTPHYEEMIDGIVSSIPANNSTPIFTSSQTAIIST